MLTQNELSLRAALSLVLAAWDAKSGAGEFATIMSGAIRHARQTMYETLPADQSDLSQAQPSAADIERFIKENGF